MNETNLILCQFCKLPGMSLNVSNQKLEKIIIQKDSKKQTI